MTAQPYHGAGPIEPACLSQELGRDICPDAQDIGALQGERRRIGPAVRRVEDVPFAINAVSSGPKSCQDGLAAKRPPALSRGDTPPVWCRDSEPARRRHADDAAADTIAALTDLDCRGAVLEYPCPKGRQVCRLRPTRQHQRDEARNENCKRVRSRDRSIGNYPMSITGCLMVRNPRSFVLPNNETAASIGGSTFKLPGITGRQSRMDGTAA